MPRTDIHAADAQSRTDPLRHQPSAAEVDALIDGARRHVLGLDFLLHGQLGSVAMIFGTHAFTVDAARDRLAKTLL
jgi:hypothetical protein